MEVFRAVLEAREPALGCARAYRLEAGTDLFGSWLVDVTFGRISTPGRRIRYLARDEDDARRLVRRKLCRRGTGERRIGVGYRVRELIDADTWFPVTVTSVDGRTRW